jgi:glycine betaine/proline transport system permease protein
MIKDYLKRYPSIWLLIGVVTLQIIQKITPLAESVTDPGGRRLPDYSVISRPPPWLTLPIADWFNVFFNYLQNDLGLSVYTRMFAQWIRFLLDVVKDFFLGNSDFTFEGLTFLAVAAIAYAVISHWLSKDWMRIAAIGAITVAYIYMFQSEANYLMWAWIAAVFFAMGFYLNSYQLGLITLLVFVYFTIFGEWVGVPWLTMAAMLFVIGYYLKGIRLALLASLSFVYFAWFGQWELVIDTLSLVLVATTISFAIGLTVGVIAWRFEWFEVILRPTLNLFQSLPHFSYLIPVVVFFGVGFHAGAIATIIFSTPPMVRLTILGLKKVSHEVIEAGLMNGCNPVQLMIKVRIPSARQELLIGVNQVIMQSLAMVVIASFIGAPGLGYRLLQLLQSLKLGKSLELGVSVVLIALVLDKMSLAWAHRLPDYQSHTESFIKRNRYILMFVGLAAGSLLIASYFPVMFQIPKEMRFSTSDFWDSIIDWITFNLFDTMQVVRRFMSLWVLIPIRNFYLSLSWLSVVLIAGGSGYIVGGWRGIWFPLAYVGFIALSGWWDRAVITAYMVSFALIVCILIGFPFGVWASLNERRSRFVLFLMDTLQTFPSFIYLIPVIMLFQVNDVAAVTAVLAYTFVPIIRYTIEGLQAVPEQYSEASDMSGCTTWQKLWKVKIPLALPTISVGLNQALLFALFMAIIAAFIGTQDLGQEMMRAMAGSDVGKALVLGIDVAFIGMTVDYITNMWSDKRKKELGLP